MYILLKFKKLYLAFVTIIICITAAGIVCTCISAEETVNLPILMYHSVLKDESKTGKYVITPQSIEEDLKYLKERGYTGVSASDVINYVIHDGTLPDKPYLITLDDGCYNNLTYVLPLLEKYDAYAVISIVGSYSESFSESGDVNSAYSYLRWEDIKKLNNSGRVEIANHSYDMHSIGKHRIGSKKISWEDESEYIDKFSKDCLKTQRLLIDNCGIEPVIYTYPFGAYCEESHEFLNDNGFIMTLSCEEGINRITRNSDCLYTMMRINRPGKMSSAEFFTKHKIK